MATPLGTTFSTDEQVVTQGDVTCMGRMVESLVVKFEQAKYEEFLSSGSKSPKVRQYRKVSSEIRSWISSEASPNVVCAESIMAGRTTRNARVNVSHKTREASLLMVKPATPALFLSSWLPRVLNNLYGVTGTPNIDRGDAHVNYRHKKLEQLSVQQI